MKYRQKPLNLMRLILHHFRVTRFHASNKKLCLQNKLQNREFNNFFVLFIKQALEIYRLHPVLSILSYGYNHQRNIAEYIPMKTKADVDVS
jgi:hypothetical protein